MSLPNSLMAQIAQAAAMREILFSRRYGAARGFPFSNPALAGYC